MSYYENVFIARQDISTTQVEALTDAFAGVIEKSGGQIAKREYWGLKNLAYRIKKNRKGHYVLLNIDAAPEAVHEMERQMRIHEDVLRHMTLKIDEIEEGPSAMMQSRGSRDGRRRDGPGGREHRDGPGGREHRDGPGGREPREPREPRDTAEKNARSEGEDR